MSRRFRHRLTAPAVLLLSICIGPPSAVLGADYGIDVVIRSEEDLYHLAAAGTISEETLETLLDLLQAPVNLRHASRDELYVLPGLTYADVDAILAHRRQAGARLDPSELAAGGILTAEQSRSIAPFVVVRNMDDRPNSDDRIPDNTHQRASTHSTDSTDKRNRTDEIENTDSTGSGSVRGNIRLRSRYIVHDPIAPPLLARAAIAVGTSFSAGATLVGTRLSPGEVTYDRSRAILVAPAPELRWRLAKVFATWARDRATVTVGTFRIGFAERLTLDNSTRRTPGGASPDNVVLAPSDAVSLCRYSTAGGAEPVCADRGITHQHVAPDFRWREGFRGAAVNLAPIPIGSRAALTLHGFVSYQARSIYQYELLDRRSCAGLGCSAPPIFDAADPARRFAFLTLPHVHDELAVGGRIAVRVADRLKVGLTGFHARPFWRVGGAALDFAASSSYPSGGAFGAVGLDGALHAGPLNLFFEAARSLDHGPHGGGFGVLPRAVLSWPGRELELSARYYDRNFANPYARPMSAPDEMEGNRARNELGIRWRFFASRGGGFRLSSSADLWTTSDRISAPDPQPPTNVDLYLRLVVRPWRLLELASWADYVNRDLGMNGRGLCYDGGRRDAMVTSSGDASAGCPGELHRLTARFALLSRRRAATAALQYGQAWVSDPRYPTTYRRDALLAAHLGFKPSELFRVDARCRYNRRALGDETHLESTFSSSIDVATAPSRRLAARARYEWVAHLDHRATTVLRVPNPEHRVHLDLEGHF